MIEEYIAPSPQWTKDRFVYYKASPKYYNTYTYFVWDTKTKCVYHWDFNIKRWQYHYTNNQLWRSPHLFYPITTLEAIVVMGTSTEGIVD